MGYVLFPIYVTATRIAGPRNRATAFDALAQGLNQRGKMQRNLKSPAQ